METKSANIGYFYLKKLFLKNFCCEKRPTRVFEPLLLNTTKVRGLTCITILKKIKKEVE